MSAAKVTAIRTQQIHTYLSPEQVSELVPGMTRRKLQRHRDDRTGPRYRKIGQTIVYAEADVRAWVEHHVVTTRQQPGVEVAS